MYSYGINRGTVIEFTMKMSLGPLRSPQTIEEEVKTNEDDSSVRPISKKAVVKIKKTPV